MSGLESRFSEKQKLAGDINTDREISVEDAQYILLYYVRNTLSGQSVTWETLLGRNAQAQTLPQTSAMPFRYPVYHRKPS